MVGERELHARDCATLTQSVTLVLALAFGPDVEIENEAAASGTAQTPATTPSTSASASSDAAVTTPPAAELDDATTDDDEAVEETGDDEAGTPWPLGFMLGGGAELSLLPAASLLISAGILLEPSPSMLLQLRLHALPAVSKALTADADARFDALAATGFACSRLVPLIALCGGARIAALRARSHDLFRDDSATAPWYALLTSLGASWPATGPVRIGLEVALAVSLNRPRFAVHGLDTVHRVPLFAPELSVLLQLWP